MRFLICILAIRDDGSTDAHELICAPENKRWTGALFDSSKLFLSAKNDSPENFSGGSVYVGVSMDAIACILCVLCTRENFQEIRPG
jgi:hypothetical protein